MTPPENYIDLFAKKPIESQRGLAIDYEIGLAVENWIVGDYDEAVYLTSLAEYHLKMSDKDFEEKYNEEE